VALIRVAEIPAYFILKAAAFLIGEPGCAVFSILWIETAEEALHIVRGRRVDAVAVAIA
jgi:hypothetical protein